MYRKMDGKLHPKEDGWEVTSIGRWMGSYIQRKMDGKLVHT